MASTTIFENLLSIDKNTEISAFLPALSEYLQWGKPSAGSCRRYDQEKACFGVIDVGSAAQRQKVMSDPKLAPGAVKERLCKLRGTSYSKALKDKTVLDRSSSVACSAV